MTTLHKLAPDHLTAERHRYEHQAADPNADNDARRDAAARLAELDADDAPPRAHPSGHAQKANRWMQVDLPKLIQGAGCQLADRSDGTLVGDHATAHASRSGSCLVVWPSEGRWWCSSCKAGGDAA